jgi:ankyrin repeat protein
MPTKMVVAGAGQVGGRPSGPRGEAETPLHGFAWCGQWRQIRRLVRKGHDVDVRDDIGETPLHGAAASGRCTTVRMLLKLGADPNATSTEGLGMTPLHWAAGWGNLGTVRALLRAGADRSARNGAGRTPAEEALGRGNSRIAVWLIDATD